MIVDPARTPEKQDLKLALRAAARASELTKDEPQMQASVLDTLARVYFSMGDVAKAIELQQRAIDLATDTRMKADMQKTLELYKTPAVKG
jgi:tetratricopeptide (TPR) repeat protein